MKPGAGADVLAEALALVLDSAGRTGAHRRGLTRISSEAIAMLMGVPLGEIALLLAARRWSAGVVTGMLAGLFGIGGGAVIVPVLYEIFRILGVPEEVRMQLCVGTSLAIIVPTTIRSFLAHRAKGAVLQRRAARLGGAGGGRRRGRRGDRGVRAERGVQARVRGGRRRIDRDQAAVRPRRLAARRRSARPRRR